MNRPWIALLVPALIATGCGGKGSQTKTTHPATTPAPALAITKATAGSTPAECNAVGINPQGMREGTCTHGGITWVIVDENHMLKLGTLWAQLASVRTTRSLSSATAATTANGEFVIASVTITNKLSSPQTFDAAGTQQAGLILDGAVFRETVGAQGQADSDSCEKLGKQIQPGQSVTCDVIFDVPAHAASDVGKHGSGDLYLVNFGTNLAAGLLPQRIGQIRLYH